jgi:hypothetical protein
MAVFSEEQLVFLNTVYDFCKMEYRTVKDNTLLSEFIDDIIYEALEDKEYRTALYQKFYNEEQIIYILSYICSKIKK